MLGHQPAQPAAQPQEAPVPDEEDARVAELQTEHRVEELVDPSSSLETKKKILTGIRASFEKCSSMASSSALLQRAIMNPLISVAPSDPSLRSLTLEYISRVPISDVPKESIQSLLAFCVETLQSSHEDDGALAQQITSDIFKAYKSLEDLSTPYLQWLLQLFDSIPAAASKYIVSSGKKSKVDEPIPAACSIKLSQDIAMTAFSLFQAYPRKLNAFCPDLVGKMVTTMSLDVPAPPEDNATASRLYRDLKLAQVKALIFLVILSRSQTAKPIVEQHQQAICDALLTIMKTAPPSLPLRKEILNAFRTLLTSDDLNKGLLPKIEELLDMDCLIGKDKAVSESLKQVAFIHLTELLLLVKQDIKVEYIQKVVDMAIASLMDVTAPLTLQVTSVRVLYNIVVDIVFPRRPESEQFRDILSSILDCMLTKLNCLCVEIPRILSISRDLDALHKRRKEEKEGKDAKEDKKGVAKDPGATSKVVPEVKQEDDMDIDKPVDASQAEACDVENAGSSTLASLQRCFKTVHQSQHQSSLKERELLEFRNLAHGLVNTSKTVAYVVIVYHTSRGLKGPVASHIKPWSSRKSDVRILSQILKSALRFISLFERLVPTIQNFDPRDVLREMYSVIMDQYEYINVVGPNIPFIFETVVANSWYLGFVRNLIEEETGSENRNRTFSNRYAIACILDFLVSEKIDALRDVNGREGAIVLQLFQMCFETLPRIQNNDVQRAPQLAANGVPGVERVVQPYVIEFLKRVTARLSENGEIMGYMKAIRSLFFALAATNKFLDIQARVGSSGLHAQIVDTFLSLMKSPVAANKEMEDMCAEICLLVPARLEHLIPLIPRMMQAAVVALNSGDRSVHIALRVLDVWVESFNPEFIERSMSRVTKPLMTALWSHIKPQSQGQFGHKVASMLGKMGGRGRRCMGENASVNYKDIPEYGMRVILAFPPHTSFLVPLDRCVQLAWSTVSTGTDPHRRKNSLRLLQICSETLSRLHLPNNMLEPSARVLTTGEEGQKPDSDIVGVQEIDKAKEAEDIQRLDEENLKKLKNLLFDPSDPPEIPADLVWPQELGVKTKKQHAAEKKMLENVLTALISSSNVEDDIDGCESRAFAHATCKHYAILMTAGWSNMAIPPWAPPSSKMVKYDVLQGIPAYIATLKHLQPHILLDAFENGLQRESEKERKATIECMSVFLDTLLEIGKVQQDLSSGDIVDSREADKGFKDQAEEKDEKEDPEVLSVRDKLAREVPYLSIQQDLVTRARHCCYGDTWSSKLGGVMALDMLSKRMPESLLTYAAHYIVKALMTVLRSFPENAVQDIQTVTSVIMSVVSRANGLSSDGVRKAGIHGAPQTAMKEAKKEDELEEAEDEEDEEGIEEPQVTTRRGKRSKRSTRATAASRKKQKRETNKDDRVEKDKAPDTDQSKEASRAERDAVRLHNDLLQAVMSSKNNGAVRTAATQCLELLSSTSGTSIGAMLDQILSRQPASKSLLERRILPLRSIAAQTNYAHSTAFLFRHCPALGTTDSLCTFVADCCTVLEQDDATIAASTSIRGQPPKQSIIFKLKLSCLEVLVESLGCPEFRSAKDDAKVITHRWDSVDPRDNGEETMISLQSRIVSAFVRNSGSSSDRIVELSKVGLGLAKEHDILPKVNLNESMKPLLTNLYSISSLSVARLGHLHHLLDVIPDSFQDTLGNKFVEHLQAWVDFEKQVVPAMAAGINGAPAAMEPGTECELAVAMLNVFHKLPSWAAGFLETQALGDNSSRPGLVVLTIGLEQCLSSLPGPAKASVCWSPYRVSLVRYLSRYPDLAIDYFVKTTRLSSPDYFALFSDIIEHPSGKTLLEQLMQRSDTIIGALEGSGKDAKMVRDAQHNCIQLVRTICDLSPNWLPNHVFEACKSLWESGNFEETPFADLTMVLLNFVRRNDSEAEFLLKLADAFVGRSNCDLTVLKDYMMRDFPRESSEEVKRKVLLSWIDSFKIDTVGEADVVKVRFILRPTIDWLVQHDQPGVLSPDIIEKLVTKVFGTVLAEDSVVDELFQSEVIQLCVALVQHVPHLLREYKKLIIQCIWWTLKKDNIAKSYAFLCVAHFFRAYLGNKDDENDINLVLKAFFNMLRMNAHDSATREAVKQAIDLIIPILGEQAEEGGDSDLHSGGDTPDGNKKRLIFPSALKRLLREEGMLSPVMVLVMQMVVRNREAFYTSRLSLIPLMLANLNKYGLPNQSTIDSRILAVDMAVTMYWWDEKAKAENKVGGKATLLTKDMDTSILNFLLRMTFVSCEVRDRDETGWKKLHAHCLNTLRDAAKHRKDCAFKLQFFEKLLHNSAQQQKQQAAAGKSVGPNPVLLTGLRIFALFMEHQPSNLVECCHQQLALMIEPSIYSKNLSTIEPLSTAIQHFYSAYPNSLAAVDPSLLSSPAMSAAASVQGHFISTLEKYLAHVAEVDQFSTDVFWFACNCVRVMKGATEASPNSMDEVLLLLLRAMNRVAKEHSKQPQLGLLSSKGMPQESLSNAEFGSGAWFMYHALGVSVPSALVLSPDHRKLFLSTVVELMAGNPVRQGQTHSGILFSVMRLLRDWLLDESVDYLNPKESLVLLQRLAQVDRLHAIPTVLRKIWDKDFLDFLYTLITTKTNVDFGNDVFTKVERPFCCGLQNPDPAVRAKFFKLYSDRIPRDLFERLRYIIQTQEWEFLSNTFWLKHAVALLFDCLHMEDPVTLAYNAAHVPQLFDYKESLIFPTKDKSGGGTSAENDPMEVFSTGDTPPMKDFVVPQATDALLKDHLRFLKEESGLRSESLVSCLIEQVQTDPNVAHHLWVLLFPIVWTSLQKEQQTGLAKPIIHLLSKEHHVRQSLLRPTVGQTLLDGISMSQPQPKIPAEMIKYMGRHFHAWHTAISMLESHVGLFPQDMRCFDAVCDLYSILGEEDMRCGLWQRRAAAPETAMAMALQQHGFVPLAQSIFLEMMSRGVSGDVSGFTKSEMVLWHNQYLSCCMELNQWEVVAEYAKSVDNSALRLEASAKLYDWSYLKTMIAPNAQVEEGPEFTLVKAQMQMSDMTLLEVDKMCKTALSQCITRWWQMPETSPWSYASVLHSFQRTVELMESWRVLMEFSMQGGQAGQYQELKDIADTWKLRTPNEWEPVQWWSDILTWRNHVYNTTIRQFSNLQSVNPNLHQLGYRDKAWSVNRLGHVARLHHLPEACIRIINTLYGFNAMEVQEAFVKVQEQAKAYMQKPTQYIQGLNLINSTNMDYFNPNHHAEMFALKGELLHRLKDPEAHNTFSEALSLWPLCTEGWINWGKYCDIQYTIVTQKEQKMLQENADRAPDPHLQQQAWTWLEYTATCYIQAIRCSATQGVSLVPRLLQLLMLDVNGRFVGKHLIQHLMDIPAWIWLPWIPQMIVGLQRPEEGTVKHILSVAASHHPQYVYWQMRPALAHLKDVAYKAMTENEAKKDDEMPDTSATGATNTKASGTPSTASKAAGATSTPGVQDPTGASLPEYLAYNSAKQVMEPLRAKQTTLQTLDLFITELGQRFAARTDERLLAVVYTLQQRTYKVPLSASQEIPESLCKELSSVCKACSNAASNAGKAGSSNSWGHWNAYQMKFANDLDMTSETAPRNLGELSERLKGWRTMMEAIIEDTNPSLLRLEDVSPALMDMAVDEIMMPCQVAPSPSIPEPLYVEKMSANVHVVRRACSSSRRIAITGNDGQVKHFLVTGQQHSGYGSGEERVGQLLRAANALLESHPESRRRDLKFAAPRSQLLYPAGRIVEDDKANCLFIEAYDTFCARYGKEPDAPIIKFKEIVCGFLESQGKEGEEGEGKGMEEIMEEDKEEDKAEEGEDGEKGEEGKEKKKTEAQVRRQAFNEIIDPDSGLVGENIFSQYMYKTMIENSKTMWTFKRQFAGSVALSSLASFVLRLSGRTPSKLVISKASGALTHIELVTSYNDRLQLDIQNESVPFRFTRNMSTFIGQQGLEGHMISCAVAAAQALADEDDTRMPSLLALFLLPDVLAFIARRLNVRSYAAIDTVTPVQIMHAVMHNVVQSVTRLERVAPQRSKIPDEEGKIINPTKAMRDLFAMSAAPSNLSKHPDVTWMPWY